MVQFNVNSISDSTSSISIIGKALKTASTSTSSIIPALKTPLAGLVDMKVLIGALLIVPLTLLSPQSKKLINGHPW